MRNKIRRSGVLMHVSSLPGEYSIGSCGKEALKFVDFLAESGFSVWQVLPFGMTDGYNSPYKSVASFGANPFFIDLPTLFERGYITKDELDGAKQDSPYICEFDRLRGERLELLTLASVRACGDKSLVNEMKSFFDDNPELLSAARFLSLSEKNGSLRWNSWTDFEPSATALNAWKFIQYEFFRQWMKVKKYANEKGISIIGDLPIYVDYESADVFASPDSFLLDKDNFPLAVAGVPPDAFSEEGQLWGNPLYDWFEMKKDGYSLWKRRIEYALTLFDGIRIDHFRGFEAYWSIPKDSVSAKDGRWVKGPGRAIVDVIKKAAGDKLIIAEDLGVITDGVNKLLKYSNFPGMRVLQFGFLGDDSTPHLPHNYVTDCVAYTGTHDNNTLLGYLFESDEGTRRRIFDYCSYYGDNISDGAFEVIKTVMRSGAGTVIFPIQDLLGFGSDTRMNTPGVAKGNWSYRVTEEQLCGIDRAKFAYLNRLYNRVNIK